MILPNLARRACIASATLTLGLSAIPLARAQSAPAGSARLYRPGPPDDLIAAVIEAGASIQQALWDLDEGYLDRFDPIRRERLALMDPADGWLSPSTTLTARGNQQAWARYTRLLDLFQREIDVHSDYSQRLVTLALDPAIAPSARQPFNDYLSDYSVMFFQHRADATRTFVEFLFRLMKLLDWNYQESKAGRATLDGSQVRYGPDNEAKAQQMRDDIHHWSLEYTQIEQAIKAEPPRPSQIRWRRS
ncbi:hypothetical protein BH10PSE17_BH10PSE17_11480 [soil metagenome]